MDQKTKTILDNFSLFLGPKLKERKEIKHLQIDVGKWSVHDIRVTLEIFIDRKPLKIDFDLRELKENESRFEHFLDYTVNQILTKNLVY